MNFVRVSTRLYCDIYEIYRTLTMEKRLTKHFNWADGYLKIDETRIQANISEKEPYQKVVWSMEKGVFSATFNIMQCTSKTEYCTEVHLMLKKENQTLTELEANQWRLIGEVVLEMLREHYNKDWVITDEDLSRGEFRGSF